MRHSYFPERRSLPPIRRSGRKYWLERTERRLIPTHQSGFSQIDSVWYDEWGRRGYVIDATRYSITVEFESSLFAFHARGWFKSLWFKFDGYFWVGLIFTLFFVYVGLVSAYVGK